MEGTSGRGTFAQRRAANGFARYARKHRGEALSASDWETYLRFGAQPTTRWTKRLLRALPSTPRCGFCGAPFAGIGARIVGPLGFRPSRKNPNICAACVEAAPAGGTTTQAGVLFVDVRGFTSLSETVPPDEVSRLLRGFYGHAEHVLLPHALIDKLIGDQVMAVYTSVFVDPGELASGARMASLMLEHARALLAGGRGALELGIGMDFGEVFIGNIGDGAVSDFTAVGDVVNTASRLQAEAGSGEIVMSERLAALLDDAPGTGELVTVKGKAEPVPIRRIRSTA